MVFAAVFGAVSCADGGTTEPFRPVGPYAGLEAQYDSVAPAAEKDAPPPSFSRTSLLRPSASVSGAGSLTNITSIPFAPEAGPFAVEVPGCDECVFGGADGQGYDIGFTFNFYGTNYTKFFIGTNGFVTFTRPSSNGCCHGMPVPLLDAINNMVAVAWVDLAPLPGQISFETRGTAPRRRLIVNFDQVAVFGEGGRRVTAQLILYEGTNAIELHTTEKPPLTRHWLTQAAENGPATEAAFVAGRIPAVPHVDANYTWSIVNDAVRFSGEVVNQTPVANAGGNAGNAPNRFYEGVEGAPIQFVGSGDDADGDQLSFGWDFNKDNIIDLEGAQVSYAFEDNGTHTATLIVNDGRGGVNQASVDVVVSNAAPSVNAGDDVSISAGQSVNLSGSFHDPGARDNPWHWTWNISAQDYYFDVTSDQSAPILGSHRFCRAGTFPVKLTVTDKDGAFGSDELLVTVSALPVEIAINPNTINLNGVGHAMVMVRIYSREGLDATALNPDGVKLTGAGGRGTSPARTGGGLWLWYADADLNGDGRLDVAAGFRRDQLIANGDLTLNSTELTLSAQLGSCEEVQGKAAVRAKVQAKGKSAGSALQPTGPAATPMDP